VTRVFLIVKIVCVPGEAAKGMASSSFSQSKEMDEEHLNHGKTTELFLARMKTTYLKGLATSLLLLTKISNL
jgi:hypothetical protein